MQIAAGQPPCPFLCTCLLVDKWAQWSGLTSPRQVNFPGVAVCLEGGQQPRFGTLGRRVSAARHRELPSRVSILVDPSFIRAAAGFAHLEPSQANQLARSEPFFFLFSHRCQVTARIWILSPRQRWWMSLSQANLWLCWVYFRHCSELSSNRLAGGIKASFILFLFF